MKLFIGLGNPGKSYLNTRHNVGQTIVTRLTSLHHLSLKPFSKLQAKLAETTDSNGDKIIFGILDTYMNESGLAVRKIIDFFKILPENLYVIHDDLDIPVGEFRLQFDRGPAGHNGIISIADHLHTQAFHRYRVGINHPHDGIPVESYVLQPFKAEEKVIIDPTTDKIIADIAASHLGP